jgi:hypothetical protein
VNGAAIAFGVQNIDDALAQCSEFCLVQQNSRPIVHIGLSDGVMATSQSQPKIRQTNNSNMTGR